MRMMVVNGIFPFSVYTYNTEIILFRLPRYTFLMFCSIPMHFDIYASMHFYRFMCHFLTIAQVFMHSISSPSMFFFADFRFFFILPIKTLFYVDMSNEVCLVSALSYLPCFVMCLFG